MSFVDSSSFEAPNLFVQYSVLF